MFHVSFLVEDRKLPEVLRSLDGRVMDLVARPAVNVEKKNGQPVEKNPGMTALDVIVRRFARADGFRQREAGVSSASVSAVLRRGIELNLLSRKGEPKRYEYHVVRALPAPKRGGK